MTNIYLITQELDETIILEGLAGCGTLKYIPCTTEKDIMENCKDADILISMYEPITSSVMDVLERLKFISLFSIGYNTVDVDCASRKGIYVANIPNYCVEEVADHTVALILTLSRKLFIYNQRVQQGEWRYDCAGKDIFRLSSRTVGLLGLGNIARKVASRMKSFGCRVIAYDPYIGKQLADDLGVELMSMEGLLGESHVISLHLPLNGETEKLLNKKTFSLMSQKPILVNCARGGVIDEKALVDALDSGQISAAGLDVLESEAPDLGNCGLLHRDNVILTPHAAFYSCNSMEESYVRGMDHVKYFLQGRLDKISLVNRLDR
ncbi:MAG: Dehydrogenase [Synergistales bacterium 53_16]|nr:MAG: Dehydrogenase [Synergistales bacterium 53_16]